MIRADNHRAIADKGANLCGNDDFHVVRCKRCGHQYLYENEVGLVYPNPEDLREHFFMWQGEPYPACSGCGEVRWSFEEINEEERQQVEAGLWGWSLE